MHVICGACSAGHCDQCADRERTGYCHHAHTRVISSEVVVDSDVSMAKLNALLDQHGQQHHVVSVAGSTGPAPRQLRPGTPPAVGVERDPATHTTHTDHDEQPSILTDLTVDPYQALAAHNHYQLDPVEQTRERAVARVTRPNGSTIEVTYTVEDATASGRLDEWVEKWNTTQAGKKWAEKYTIRRNGAEINTPWPAWVTAQIEQGRVKRFDAWWSYRADMLWKSAAKRAVKAAAPHVLLGMPDAPDAHDLPPAGKSPSPPASDAGGSFDDDIADAEIVDTEPAGSGEQPHNQEQVSPRPSPSTRAAARATDVSPGATPSLGEVGQDASGEQPSLLDGTEPFD